MTAARTSIIDEVDRLLEDRSLLEDHEHHAMAFDEKTQRYLDAPWAFLDGVHDAAVSMGQAR